MKRYLASGIVMDISLNETGGYNVQVICPHITYTNWDEGLQEVYNMVLGACNALKSEGIFSGEYNLTGTGNSSVSEAGGDGKSEQNKQTQVKNGQTTKKVKGEAHKGKNSKGKSRATAINGVPPEDKKVIKTPVGRYIMVPDKATVELFGMDKIQTMAGVNIIGDPAGARAFTVNGKRYIAEFDKKGNFIGYFLSTDMKTKFTPDQVIYQNKVDDSFINKLLEITYNLGYDPDKLMAVIAHETGETFSPTIAYKKKVLKKVGKGKDAKIEKSYIPVAVGLIQFTENALKGINKTNGTNYTLNDVLKMSAEEQLDLAEKYYSQGLIKGKKLTTMEDYGVANFAPANIGKPSSNIIFKKGSIEYTQNSSLDLNKTGEITNADVGNSFKLQYVKK